MFPAGEGLGFFWFFFQRCLATTPPQPAVETRGTLNNRPALSEPRHVLQVDAPSSPKLSAPFVSVTSHLLFCLPAPPSAFFFTLPFNCAITSDQYNCVIAPVPQPPHPSLAALFILPYRHKYYIRVIARNMNQKHSPSVIKIFPISLSVSPAQLSFWQRM